MLTRGYLTSLLAALVVAVALLVPGTALAGGTHASGGTPYMPPPHKARIVNGQAIAPSDAPPAVKGIIAAANQIVTKPYRYGGGHAKFQDSAYDCSGSVSFALHGANLITHPMDSSDLMHWGAGGAGRWVTVYSNAGHAFMMVAGLRFDTGYRDAFAAKHGAKPGSGPRWNKKRPTNGFKARHPNGL
jgi:cell wall-associated NlpC family hydrolase